MRPVVVATPSPGTHDALILDVSISSEEEGLTFYFGVNEEPDLEIGFPSGFNVRLNRSSKIMVSVEDADGELWGPYSFEYTLVQPVTEGACTITPPSRYFYRPTETFAVEVGYAFAAALSTLHLSIDGVTTLIGSPATLDPVGSIEVPIGPIAQEGPHTIECFVSDAKDIPGKSGSFEIVIDGTPPEAEWLSVGGSFTRADWPGKFEIEASDTLSGIAGVLLCKTGFTPCFELQPEGTDIYSYATVLTGETSLQASLTGIITDFAGNQTTLAPLEFNTLGFGEPPPKAPLAVTLVTEAVYDLHAAVLAEGRLITVAEVRSLDLGTTLNASMLPLASGWNDFLYRQAGRNEWESFGVYRAGISVAYPASAASWLVFSSQSTTAAMQGELAGLLPAGGAGQWSKPWFDVPHVWFVEDLNANTKWDNGDQLWTFESTPFNGPFQARISPVAGALTLRPSASASTYSTKTVVCEVCESTGELYFERRLTPYAYPESHSAFSGVSFSPFATDATVTVWSEPADWCGFFWDENADGVVNGTEPRNYGSCAGATFVMARQAPLSADVIDGVVHVSGVPYGGAATGELLVRDGGEVLYRESLVRFTDSNGTGHVTAAVEVPLNLPYTLVVHRGAESAAVDVPRTPPSLWTHLSVVDENGVAISAVAAVRRGDTVYGEIFQAVGSSVAVGVPSPLGGETARALAMRDGYLSVAVPITSASMSVRILGPAVTGRVIGTVKDQFGYPISNASLTWDTQVYRAKTLSDAAGWYSLPASGYTGTLRVSAPGPYRRETFYWMDVTRETVLQEIVLQDERGPEWPMGANLGVWPESLEGAYSAQTYVNESYYGARVTSGTWTVRSSYGPARTVSLPGALPPLSADSPSRLFPPGDLALSFLDQYVRCGARLQLSVSFVGVVVDSGCWGWFARDAYQEYFLGRVDEVEGFPALNGLGMMNATIFGSGDALELVDVLLGRRIRVPIQSGSVRAAIPVGLYAVFKFGGGAAIPHYTTIYATENPNVTLTLP